MSLDSKAYQVPEIFHYLSQVGQVDWEEMYHVFNMGVGLAFVVEPEDVKTVLDLLPDAFVLGQVTDQEGIVIS